MPIASKFIVHTPLGDMLAEFQTGALTKLHFISEKDGVDSNFELLAQNKLGDQLQFELEMYFNGKLRQFDIPLNPEGTVFQIQIWKLLTQIPFGKTITYMEQAVLHGYKLAIRAIASANGKNPIAILIPCHRVIGSNGDLKGYSGGIQKKKYLLELEGHGGIQKNLFE